MASVDDCPDGWSLGAWSGGAPDRSESSDGALEAVLGCSLGSLGLAAGALTCSALPESPPEPSVLPAPLLPEPLVSELLVSLELLVWPELPDPAAPFGESEESVERSEDVEGTPVGCGGVGWAGEESVASVPVDEPLPSLPSPVTVPVLGVVVVLLGWSPVEVLVSVGLVVPGGCSDVDGTRCGDVPCELGCWPGAGEPLVGMSFVSDVAGAWVGVVAGVSVDAASPDERAWLWQAAA